MATYQDATVEYLVGLDSSIASAGSLSVGYATISANLSPGDSFQITGDRVLPWSVESFVADTDFNIGASALDTLVALATALAANSGLVTAQVLPDGRMQIVSRQNGYLGEVIVESSNPSLAITVERLEGGTSVLSSYLAAAKLRVNSECFKNKTQDAQAYLAAHLMTKSGLLSSNGTVLSKKVGDLSISYAAPTPSDAELGSTRWGLLYMELRRSLFIPGLSGRSDVKTIPFVC